MVMMWKENLHSFEMNTAVTGQMLSFAELIATWYKRTDVNHKISYRFKMVSDKVMEEKNLTGAIK